MRKLQDVLREHEKAEADDRDLRSRSDARTERRQEADALIALARALTSLPEKQFRRLELDESVLEAVVTARRITSPPALNRQMKLIRRALKAIDWEPLRDVVDELANPGRGAPNVALSPGGAWVERLVSGDAEAFSDFLAQHPRTPVSELRQAVRAIEQAGGKAKGPRARLRALVEEQLAASESLGDPTH